MSKLVETAVVILELFLFINSQSITIEKSLSLACNTQVESCSDCLNFQSVCSWCYDSAFDFERCDLPQKLNEAGCFHVLSGNKSGYVVEENKDFSDVINDVKDAVQIRPQKIKMQLRPGDTESIKFKYRAAKDYPLELYYLLDFTYTMRNDINTIIELGDKLIQSLSQLTKHNRIGFGAFSDKVVMPFSRMSEKYLRNPCPEYGTCEPPFNFKHYFNLNSNVTNFIQMLNSTTVTANLDNSEGTLDALMQVVVCENKVGWTNESRKLILLLTDGLLHYAGDGKLAGIVKRSDGLCHLDENGLFTKSNLHDYPSLSQVYRKLKENKVSVIFAINPKVSNHFKKLNDIIPNFSFVTEISNSSKNILNIIKQGYENAVALIELTDNAIDPIRMEYFSTCNTGSGVKNRTSSCYGAKEGDVFEFDIKFSVAHCPKDPLLWKQTVVIEESHLKTESLVIEIELLCGCECPVNQNDSVMDCGDHGHVECGICICDRGWSGNNCACDLSNFENNNELENMCRELTENTTSMMCYGRGDCVCGSCECQKNYNGKYCQCRECDKNDGQQCGGPNRGICDCGKCLCMPNYSGPNCLCNENKDLCKAPGEEVECSEHGTCICGSCQCNLKPITYSGKYCEKCSTCGGLCHLYNDCVKCTIEENCVDDICDLKNVTDIMFLEVIEDINDGCLVLINKTNCNRWQYIYHITRNNAVLINILTTECTDPLVNMGGLGIGIFVGILLFGIAIIAIYKIKIVRADKRECAEFLKNVEGTLYTHQNVLYRSPITEVQVPSNIRNKND